MAASEKEKHLAFLILVGLLGWLLPGAGHFVIKEKTRAIIILIAIVLTFCTGLYIGSVGVIDPVGAKAWYAAQILTSPVVAVLGYLTAIRHYTVYCRPGEIGQIYTGTAGLLNLLCVVNAVYLAHLQGRGKNGG